MKVKKISINLEKIIIDIVLCPKRNLYLQSLYCRRCTFYISVDKNYVNCNYKKPNRTISSNHDSKRNIEMLKKELFQVIKKRNTSMNIN